MRIRRSIFALALWSLIQAPCASDQAEDASPHSSDIRIAEAKWGVDGFSRHRTFVPLRIVIKNRGSLQKTLLLRLSREDAISAQGEMLEQEVIVSPDTTRIVQMTPFVADPGDTWTLRWGDAEDESLPIRSNSAEDGIVLITPASELFSQTGSLPFMNDDEFPTSVTALDTLRVVFLYQEPPWTGARRKAFQEWLLKGGTVVVLNQPDETAPKFANGFEFLNVTSPTTSYGTGQIRRLLLAPQQVSKSVIEKQILGRGLTAGNLEQKLKAYSELTRNRYSTAPGVPGQAALLSYSRDQVLTDLKDLAGTNHRWGLIYLAVFAYVGWQWRVGWRWGIMEKQSSRFYAWMLGLAIGFSLFFLIYGSFGTSGKDRVRTIAICRHLVADVHDVEGWSVLGTGLNGGEHIFSVPGSGQLYGGCESFGQHSIRVRNSKAEIDLPSFSTQKIAFRTRLEMPAIPIQLDAADPEFWQTKSSRVLIAPSYKAPVYAAVVVVGHKVYEYTGKSGQLTPTEMWGQSMHEWLNPFSQKKMTRFGWQRSLFGWLFDTKTPVESYYDAFQAVVGNGFSVGNLIFEDSFVVPEGFARVMIYTDLPDQLKQSGDFPDQDGRMLYVTDVPLGKAR